MIFNNRREAGRMLASRLMDYADQNALVLAVPRGGVVVAAPVAEAIRGDLDLIITRKIGAPYQPELALGAVTGDGFIMLNDNVLSRLAVDEAYIKEASGKEIQEIKRRLVVYRSSRPLPEINNRKVILIDDGVATGYTLLAALRSLRQQNPEKLILAVPVGPPDTLSRLEKEVDKLIYLEAPSHFAAVGQFYRDFDQVGDDEVVSILNKIWDINKD